MTDNRFHLGWFGSFVPTSWNTAFEGSDSGDWLNGDFYVDFAKTLERACFDFLLLEDSSMVSDTYGGSSEATLKTGGWAPKGDPMALAPLLTRATSHLGIALTASTSFYPPYLLARSISSLDHLSSGRIGWNVVTSSEDRAAQNFGMDALPPHDERYVRADEYVELVEKLWDSWDADAVVMDRETSTYVDHTKVHTIDFQGKYYSSRGPLNTLPSPQGRPVITQAGGSPAGRDFAAKHADMIMALPKGVAAMKEYRADIRRRMALHGRDPDSAKVMYVVSPILGETHEDALARQQRKAEAVRANPAGVLVGWSASMEIDFSTFDLDKPMPEDVHTNGHQSTLENFRNWADGRTLREACVAYRTESMELVGTPDAVAAQMGDAMAEVGGDGFLIWSQPHNRRYIGEIADGLVPALQSRGLMRTEYSSDHLRDNLLEF
ncbi:FMNH2-dependent monooxygenase [Rhodococcus sp. 15-649-2-2]|uniref:NtaA/DmoA family FMN-dependent monooxygenase n=1 Tax=Rhodococcus sp. 15-649-2-2 TaxID=2023140 RepID=UPI000B9A56FF|nr:NtaA/DmoA family FMN-dependent monooxygenase [Rhodococcus sp. 15-649-2-2]OZE78231.1 FMNH2-dependent monooxygenase [Rhodococcus sp. 15-649-2-2]